MSLQLKFNEEIENLLLKNEESRSLHGRVCVLCDKFLSKHEEETLTLKTLVKHSHYLRSDPCLPLELKLAYSFVSSDQTNIDCSALNNCLLSPRAQVIPGNSERKTPKVGIMLRVATQT